MKLKLFIFVLIFGGLLVLAATTGQIVETNKSGYYQVKQAAITGTMTVRTDPGTYLQNFGMITTYQVSDIIYFSKYKEDGGEGADAAQVQVRFNDGGTAFVTGSVKFRLSLIEKFQLLLHRDFKTYAPIKKDLVRQLVVESLIQTATLLRAEETYSTRRAEFTSLVESQIRDGIYETVYKEEEKEDAQGQKFILRNVTIKRDANGSPVIKKVSPLKQYGIDIIQFVVKDIDFDETIDALISKKKKAEQEKIVARANAEKAKQDAITAEEQGKAEIAIAKALEEVVKIKAVTQALKEKEVAVLEAEKKYEVAKRLKMAGEEDAKRKELMGKTEARVAKLKVAAGLSPRERAEFKMKTAIGIAEKLSNIQFPGMMIFGGGKGSPMNPFDAVGLDSFMKIQEKLQKGVPFKRKIRKGKK